MILTLKLPSKIVKKYSQLLDDDMEPVKISDDRITDDQRKVLESVLTCSVEVAIDSLGGVHSQLIQALDD